MMRGWVLGAAAVLGAYGGVQGALMGAQMFGVESPGAGVSAAEVARPERDYLVFVASEATDEVALVRFGPSGAAVERVHTAGFHPAEPDGPHGVAVAPDGRHFYVTTAHGVPNGYLWKYEAESGRVVGRAQLGLFPASLQISPDGLYAWVVNFNLHGDMVPSSVSVVSTAEMVEVARLTTCVMPHGSRLSPDGGAHYSACMMDDLLVEIDTRRFEVARHFMLAQGREYGMEGAPGAHGGGDTHAAHGAAGHGMDEPAPGVVGCSPTWAVASPDGTRVFVACNRSNDIVEIDVQRWALVRRIPAGEGVYNVAATHDGRLLIATNRRGASVSIFEVASGREIATLPTLRPVVHGIAVSDDDRYAFISVEGVGAEPGTVEVIDLRALERVAAVDLGQMSGGIDFWRSESPSTSPSSGAGEP